jgi:hypothetical protein
MRTGRTSRSFLVQALFFLTSTSQASAILLSNQASNTLAETIIPDSEVSVLTQFFGSSPDQVLNFHSDPSPDGSVGTLSGTYLGKNLSVQYKFVKSGFPGTSGLITFASSGLYGLQPWAGSGDVSLTLSEATIGDTIVANLTSSLFVLGSFGETTVMQKSGDLLGTDIPGRFLAISGCAGGISPCASWQVGFRSSLDGNELLDIPGSLVFSDFERGDAKLQNELQIASDCLMNDIACMVDGTITGVPEPNTLFLFGTSLAGLIAWGLLWKRKFNVKAL